MFVGVTSQSLLFFVRSVNFPAIQVFLLLTTWMEMMSYASQNRRRNVMAFISNFSQA